MGKNVKSIDNLAFKNCSSLKEITIPEKITSVSESTFEGCISIEEIIIPENVEEIGDRAFSNCKNLKNVTVLGGLQSVGTNAFLDCTKLETFSYTETKKSPICGKEVFDGCRKLDKIEVKWNYGGVNFCDHETTYVNYWLEAKNFVQDNIVWVFATLATIVGLVTTVIGFPSFWHNNKANFMRCVKKIVHCSCCKKYEEIDLHKDDDLKDMEEPLVEKEMADV